MTLGSPGRKLEILSRLPGTWGLCFIQHQHKYWSRFILGKDWMSEETSGQPQEEGGCSAERPLLE